jgi:tetratricopeptide (TPR) repeat protein
MFTKLSAVALLLIAIAFSTAVPGQVPKSSLETERAKAMTLIEANRYLDAFPILEKIAPQLPNDVDVWTHFGIALASRSGTLTDAVQRKFERKKAYDALSKAKALGTTHVMALSMLDQLPPDGGDDDNFSALDPRVESALREGEGFFGRGEYDKAFASYEKAYKIDPKNYEAMLFMADSVYAQKKYAESEPLFAKAAAISPDREMAYRFWGDALLAQNKTKEATEKFIDAFIADPYSRNSWDNINKLTQKAGKPFDVKGVFPPGTEDFGAITIDATKLTETDGTVLWRKYSETRDNWRKTIFKQQNPSDVYRRSLKEETAALRAVADAAKAAIKSGSLKNPHHSITNLIGLVESDLLEPYILVFLPDEGIAQDYEAYRHANRAKLRQFFATRVFVH